MWQIFTLVLLCGWHAVPPTTPTVAATASTVARSGTGTAPSLAPAASSVSPTAASSPPLYLETDRAGSDGSAFVLAQNAAPAAGAAASDPYGFVIWLNGVRAQYGIAPVALDPNLSAWAHANNGQQQARGMGHYVMGPARRQNSGWGGSFPGICQMWMQSPGHRAALLDPTIRFVGIAGLGMYWTFDGR